MIVRSPYPDVTIPEIPLTQFVLQRAEELGDKPALIEGPTGRVIAYAQRDNAIRPVAGSLDRRGFKKGEVFGILSPNVPEYAIIFYAVASVGGIVTPINPLYTEHEIADQLTDAGARFLVTVPACMDKASHAAREANIDELFIFGERSAGATSFESPLHGHAAVLHCKINPR